MLAKIALFCVAKPRAVTYLMVMIFIEPLLSKRKGFTALSKPDWTDGADRSRVPDEKIESLIRNIGREQFQLFKMELL